MLPGEKALVQRLADQPFSLLGINSDGDAAAVREILAANGITWRQAIDGDTDGPIARSWNVQGWPTLYLIDAAGVIRHRDVRDEAELARAIDALLAEAATKR
ncbi:MAG: TlpA family protein disulfide reductase [Planctomycetes bacterium]|nr:TlpA family protein disulfide reductase [Planctomycetota bacterium]